MLEGSFFFFNSKNKPLIQDVITLSRNFIAKSLFGVKEGGEMVFPERLKSVLIRTGGWAGHFVLSCALVLQTLVSRITMLKELRWNCRLGDQLATQMGPHGRQSYGEWTAHSSNSVSELTNWRTWSGPLDMTKVLGWCINSTTIYF